MPLISRPSAFITKPLIDLKNAGLVETTWNEHTRVFSELKDKLPNCITLSHFKPEREVEIHSDASDYAIDRVLLQVEHRLTKHKKNRFEIIAFTNSVHALQYSEAVTLSSMPRRM